ncbi:MAG: nitroreductase family protein [Candidatus Wallbacteria bacterium]|nr:nitroreductase family protein [Candidatus Wallbacteria bacterium]
MFLDLVKSRNSLRKYDPERSISRSDIELCLEAARLAPSACNSQPWSFVVSEKPECRELAQRAFSGMYSMNAFAADASAIVAVITEKSRFAAKVGGFFRGTQFSLIDIGIACEHLVLQAAELGIGSCYFGWFDERAVRKALKLPKGAKVDLLISLGYPAEFREKNSSRKQLDEIRRYFR